MGFIRPGGELAPAEARGGAEEESGPACTPVPAARSVSLIPLLVSFDCFFILVSEGSELVLVPVGLALRPFVSRGACACTAFTCSRWFCRITPDTCSMKAFISLQHVDGPELGPVLARAAGASFISDETVLISRCDEGVMKVQQRTRDLSGRCACWSADRMLLQVYLRHNDDTLDFITILYI